jgi:hypothetical protein
MKSNQIKIPEEFLQSKYRREMWDSAKKTICKMEKIFPNSSIYLLGSFTTKKKRPADVDFIILFQTKSKKRSFWSADFVVAPKGKCGDEVLEDAKKWMKQKYGAKKSAVIKIK